MLLQYLLRACILLIFASSFQLMSQDLSQYRWENRLILVVTSSEGSRMLRKQLQLLDEDIVGLKERKLLLIHVSEPESKILLPEPKSIAFSQAILKRFKSSDEPFTFLLIGLDGGVKLRRNEAVSREYLYALIDGMPMRRAEMKEKKKNSQP